MPFVPTFTPVMTTRPMPPSLFRAPPVMPFFLPFQEPQPDILRPTNADTYVSALVNDILRRLNENSNTTIFNVESGIGGAATSGITEAILLYLNEAAADLCRTGGFAIPGTATWSNMPAGTTSVPLNTPYLATGDTSALWAAMGASWNGTPLEHMDASRLTPGMQAQIGTVGGLYYSADPAYWYRLGAQGVGIFPAPSDVSDLTITGYMIPPLLATTSDRPSWLNDDLVKLLTWYVCAMVTKKNLDDPVLHARLGEWEPLWLEGKNNLLATIWQTDEALARALNYPRPMAPGKK